MTERGKNRRFTTAFKERAVKRLRKGESVLGLARKLGLSRKILHDWRKAYEADGVPGLNRKPGAKAHRAADMEMASRSHAVSLANRHYGYRRITHALRRQGVAVNGKRVQRLMREDNLIAQRRKPFIPAPADRGQSMLIVPNLVRGLVPTGLHQIWVPDITFVMLLA